MQALFFFSFISVQPFFFSQTHLRLSRLPAHLSPLRTLALVRLKRGTQKQEKGFLKGRQHQHVVCMEFVEVVGVTFPVGVEFTRRTLLRLFQTVQAVEDLVVDVNGGRAMVLFAESAAAQEALVVLDGVALFGCTLSLKIAPPPLSPVPGFVVSMRPSRFLLIRNSPYLVVVVKLKHVGGIESVTSAGVNCCFVVTKSIDDAAEATSLVKHHVNRWGTVVSVSFLRKL